MSRNTKERFGSLATIYPDSTTTARGRQDRTGGWLSAVLFDHIGAERKEKRMRRKRTRNMKRAKAKERLQVRSVIETMRRKMKRMRMRPRTRRSSRHRMLNVESQTEISLSDLNLKYYLFIGRFCDDIVVVSVFYRLVKTTCLATNEATVICQLATTVYQYNQDHETLSFTSQHHAVMRCEAFLIRR